MFAKPVVLQTVSNDWTHIAYTITAQNPGPNPLTKAPGSQQAASLYVNGVLASATNTFYNGGTPVSASSVIVPPNWLNPTSGAFGGFTYAAMPFTSLVVGDLQLYGSTYNGTFTPASLFSGDPCTGTASLVGNAVGITSASLFGPAVAAPTAANTSAGIPFSYAALDWPPLNVHLSRAAPFNSLAAVLQSNPGGLSSNNAPYASGIAFNATYGGWTPVDAVAAGPWLQQGCYVIGSPGAWAPVSGNVTTTGNTVANCLQFAQSAGYKQVAVYGGGVCVGSAATSMIASTSSAYCGLAPPTCDPQCGNATNGFVYTTFGSAVNAPPPPGQATLLSGAPLQALPSFFLTPKTNMQNVSYSSAGATWPNAGALIGMWVKNGGFTNVTDGFQQIAQLGSGLYLSAQLIANNGLALCVTGYHPYDVYTAPSTCASSTGAYLQAAPVSVYPAPYANNWIHLAFSAKYNAATGLPGYYLYANGVLVASQKPLSGQTTGTLGPLAGYYDGSPQRIGFNFEVSDFNQKLFFAELQVYSTPGGDDNANNGAALYLGGSVADFTTKPYNAALIIPTLTNSTYAQEADNVHRLFFGKGEVLGAVSNWNQNNLFDTHSATGGSTWSVVGSTAINVYANNNASQPDVGGILDSTSAYVDLGARDYGLAALTAADGMSASAPGVSFTFWLTRTANASHAGATTRLLTVLGNTYDDYSYSIGLTPRGGATQHTVDVSWPSCQGDAAFVSSLPTGTLDVAGLHHVLVANSQTGPIQVFVDGLPAVYRTQTAAAALCDLEFSTWPNNFTASNFFVGAYQAVDAGTFALIDFAVYTRALNATDASLLWKQGPPGGGDALPPPPPPLAAPANSFALPKLAACAVAPPIHRFGDFNASVAPFAGGVLADANQTQPWTAVWRSLLQPATVPANQFITLGNLTTYYTSGAYVDAGPQTFTGSGLTVGMLISNTAMAAATCTPTAAYNATLAAAGGAPSSWALFDVGGYAVYGVASTCAPGYTNGTANVAAVVTSPTGASSSYQGAGTPRNPLLPMVNERYTFVTFSGTQATIYVNGALWAVFPTVQYPGGVFSAPSVRFFQGDMHNNGQWLNITIHDIQVYDRALAPADVAALSRGVTSLC